MHVPARAAPAALSWIEGFEPGLAEAKRRGRPVFVYFDAAWCSWCQLYKRGTLADPQVQKQLRRDYVTVRVDFDARPDLAQRYRIRGLPYTLVLSPHGVILNGFVGILAPGDMRDLLTDLGGRKTTAPDRDTGIIDTISVTSLDAKGFDEFQTAFLAHLENLYDRGHGTLLGSFVTGATLKRPSPLTWLYLHDHRLWQDRGARAVRTERERLFDTVDSGFFNFLDPSLPEGDYLENSKLLESNAWLMAWQATAGGEDKAARQAAHRGWYYLRETLWDKNRGGFWQAQIADPDYYRRAPSIRRSTAPPPLDYMKRTDTNAQTILALLRYAQVSGDAEPADYALRTLRFLLHDMVRDGRLYHLWRDGVHSAPDLPLDAFWLLAAAALLDSSQLTPAERQTLAALAIRAGCWLSEQMRAPRPHTLTPELAGLIARVAGDRTRYPQLPAAARDWALRQLQITPDTPPDDLVFGLQAWHARLEPLGQLTP